MEKLNKIICLLSILFAIFSCNKTDKINSDEIQNSKESINENVLKEISANKNEIVFLSFYPNMSDEVFEYLLEKEKLNKNISKPQRNIFNYIYQIPIKENTLDFSINKIENGIELNHNYDYWAKERSDEDIKIGKQNSLIIIDQLVKLYKSKYPEFEVKKNIIGDRSIDTKYFMTGSVDYLIFYDSKKIIVFSSSFESDSILNFMSYNENNNKVNVYSYSINIKYYSINSFNKMRDEKIKDSLEYLENKKVEKELKKDIKLKKINKTLKNI